MDVCVICHELLENYEKIVTVNNEKRHLKCHTKPFDINILGVIITSIVSAIMIVLIILIPFIHFW